MTTRTIDGKRVIAWAVVYQAGYVNEQVEDEFATYDRACDFRAVRYDADEVVEYHVEIAARLADGSLSYDF